MAECMCSLVLVCPASVCYMIFIIFFAAVISGESGQSIPLQQSVSSLELSVLLHQVSATNLPYASIRVNIGCGRAEERFLLTGLHAVADIYCNSCKTTLGWKYVSHCRVQPLDASSWDGLGWFVLVPIANMTGWVHCVSKSAIVLL